MASSFLLRMHVGLRPHLTQTSSILRQATVRTFTINPLPLRPALNAQKPGVLTLITRDSRQRFALLLTATGIAGAALGISSFTTPATLHCDDVSPPQISPPLPPPPQSSVNPYELTFGTICGLCTGVFVKKGTRMAAFLVGGVFVLLQYLGSMSLVKVDWPAMASRFENLFYATDVRGKMTPPTIGSLWRWIIDFLTADFQPRASFIAGFALGLRVG
ncbi:hypothetical protein PAXRUDRAFT_834642 [Paxillus rubicundulus Ve08.2h10]|uniref:FUN14 domain-containing protein n=1 Tax=Paxillus rubicundulus Ve08.2h10 TaxID=930991 RepID=A0A0D0DJG1_9AGAM|nr:hypothetical protein PAXRUDRAFT_834642 [Paxillus rubicundulus Ve08.2h10]